LASNLKVIIVEDDPMVAQINKRYLQKVQGFSLAGVFPNGKAAIDFLEKQPVDLVVLDVYMPELNGLELMRRMRAQNLQPEVIMVTAANDAKQVDEFLKLGVVDYLVKPFTEERFIEALKKSQARIRLADSSGELSQQAIDRLMGGGEGPRHEPKAAERKQAPETPKGLQPSTLEMILKSLQASRGDFRDCEELASQVGLSKVTVRRYLNHLTEKGQLESSIDYDTGGRPSVMYRLK
jgi:response regulator of citrate/malate metabolism